MNSPIIGEPTTATMYRAAPLAIPTAIAQKVKAISAGSLIAVLKRIMLKAPIIPNERATLELIGIVTNVTTNPTSTNVRLKFLV